jgi:hypothetical protein
MTSKCNDTVFRQAAIDTEGLDAQIRCEMCKNPMYTDRGCDGGCDGNCKYDEKLYERIMQILNERIKPLPSTQPEYEPVKAEDFAKTMSENTLYSFMAWHGEALELMERQGFVICKKTM